MCGCFQISDRVILADTKLKSLSKAKSELEPKARFYKGWVYISNAQGYNGYFGKTNIKAIDNEMSQIPQDVKDAIVTNKEYTPSIHPIYPIDGTINSKSEIINNKGVVKGGKPYSNISDLDSDTLKEISVKYQVSLIFVEKIKQQLELYCESKDISYKNYKATLMAWVLRKLDDAPKSARLKDLDPHQIEDLRLHPEKLSIYTKAGYDTSRRSVR
jgi:hypothetical protein